MSHVYCSQSNLVNLCIHDILHLVHSKIASQLVNRVLSFLVYPIADYP